MTRMLPVAMLMVVSAIFLSNSTTSGQDSPATCKNCPASGETSTSSKGTFVFWPMICSDVENSPACKSCPASGDTCPASAAVTAQSCATDTSCNALNQSCTACSQTAPACSKSSVASCEGCPSKQNSTVATIEFELTGVDFMFDAWSNKVVKQEKPVAECQSEVATQKWETCESGVPFLSNLPYVNRLFKNKSATMALCQDEAPCCDQSSECGAKDGVCFAVGTCTAKNQTGCNGFANPTWVQLTGFVPEDNGQNAGRSELAEHLVEMRIENERLRAQLQAMERQVEMMGEMCKVREQNAGLKATVALLERHRAHAVHSNHSSASAPMYVAPAQLAVPSQIHPPHNHFPLPVSNPNRQVHPPVPHHNAHPSHTVPRNFSTSNRGQLPPAVPELRLPQTKARSVSNTSTAPPIVAHPKAVANAKAVEIVRLTEQVKKLQQQLMEAKKNKAENRDVKR